MSVGVVIAATTNFLLGAWLIVSPETLDYEPGDPRSAQVVLGSVVALLALRARQCRTRSIVAERPQHGCRRMRPGQRPAVRRIGRRRAERDLHRGVGGDGRRRGRELNAGRMKQLLAALAAALTLAIAGCDYPRDSRGTLDRVEGGALRVGVIDDRPWAHFAGARPVGVEVELVRQFARELDANVRWRRAAEHELFEALRGGELDLVIGGLTRRTPWKKHAALTRPYTTTRLVIGTEPRQRAPDDLSGVAVAVEADSPVAALVREKTDATAVELPRLPRRPAAAATERFLLEDLALIPAAELASERHVMAVRRGESGFLVRLERFLLNRDALVARLKDAATP